MASPRTIDRTHPPRRAEDSAQPAELVTRYLSENPGIAEALELFAVSRAIYERSIHGLASSTSVSSGSTLTVAVDVAHLG